MTTESLDIEALNARFEKAPTQDILQWAADSFGERAAIGTSFQGAGIVMMHLATSLGLRLPFFTLDTGLLFPETLELKQRLEAFLHITIESLTPELSLPEQERIHGAALWGRDPDACCTLRKVEPLQRKLGQLDCWITGLRREQSAGRADIRILELYEFDPVMNRTLAKLNPMARWNRDEVWDYLRRHNLPYNPLQDRGYRSIGCVPCTRVAGAADGERAGRWTGFQKTECGIHTFMKRKNAP